jgi:hypothetical protein
LLKVSVSVSSSRLVPVSLPKAFEFGDDALGRLERGGDVLANLPAGADAEDDEHQ